MRAYRSLLSWCFALSLFGAPAFAAGATHSPRDGARAETAGPRVLASESAAPSNATGALRERQEMRARANAGLVGIVSGEIDSTDLKIVTDLESVLDQTSDGLRILPVAGKGSVQNVTDLLFARGIDAAILQADVLADLKRKPPFPGVEDFLQYVCMLYDEEVHVLAPKSIGSVQELAGKKVNVDVNGSGTALTASVLFGALGVAIEPTNFDQPLALEKLKQGEISALVYVVGKPVPLFQEVERADNLHFLPIAANDNLRKTYTPATLTAHDYPQLVDAGGRVSTVSVASVLAVYNWPQGTKRYDHVVRFVNAFFTHFGDLQAPPYHPKWQRIDLAAELPGWTRFPPAEQRIRHAALSNGSAHRAELTPAMPDQEAIFRQFVDYLAKQQREALFRDFAAYLQKQAKPTAVAGLPDPAAREQLFREFAAYQRDLNRAVMAEQAQGLAGDGMKEPERRLALMSAGRVFERSPYLP